MLIAGVALTVLSLHQNPRKQNVVIGGATTSLKEQALAQNGMTIDYPSVVNANNMRMLEGLNVNVFLAASAVCPPDMLPVELFEQGFKLGETAIRLSDLKPIARATFTDLFSTRLGAPVEAINDSNPDILVQTFLQIKCHWKGGPPAELGFKLNWSTVRSPRLIPISIPTTKPAVPSLPTLNFYTSVGLETEKRNAVIAEAQQVYIRWLNNAWKTRLGHFKDELRSQIAKQEDFAGLPKKTPKTAAELPPMLKRSIAIRLRPAIGRNEIDGFSNQIVIDQMYWEITSIVTVRDVASSMISNHVMRLRRLPYGF
ncbi:MAG: hypothetical protein JST35_04465 [Armatimonadetes bacterium]|nr:hypothetical protein [Armatimonadota bacterium]